MWHRAWLEKRKLKSGKTSYLIRWYGKSGKLKSKSSGTDRKFAEKHLREIEYEINSPDYKEVQDMSFQQFKSDELKRMKGRVSKNSLIELEHTLRIFQEITEVEMISDVSLQLIQSFVSHRLNDVKVATVNKNIRTLKSSLNRAFERGCLTQNPASNVKEIREAKGKVRVLSSQEVESLINACHSDRWKAFICLALTTGMRLGELTALRWDDVNFDEKTVWVGNTPEHETKSKKNRTLSLLDETADLLRCLPRKGIYVFQTKDGKKWKNNIQRGFRNIVKKSGIKYCTIHDLRRTFITHLAETGASAMVVKELAGHASIETTLTYYTNISTSVQRSAQEKLPYNRLIGDSKIITKSSIEPSAPGLKEDSKVVNFDEIVS